MVSREDTRIQNMQYECNRCVECVKCGDVIDTGSPDDDHARVDVGNVSDPGENEGVDSTEKYLCENCTDDFNDWVENSGEDQTARFVGYEWGFECGECGYVADINGLMGGEKIVETQGESGESFSASDDAEITCPSCKTTYRMMLSPTVEPVIYDEE